MQDPAQTSQVDATGTGMAGPKPVRVTGWRRFRRHVPAVVGLGIVVVFLIGAVFAPLFTPYDPTRMDLSDALLAPTAGHPLGTDHLGRDILARILHGARYSLLIGLLAVTVGMAVGVPLGLVSGYYGRWVDMTIQRLADALFAFPTGLLALALVAVLGASIRNVVIAVGVSLIPSFIRLVRGSVLVIREQVYVEAARAIGASDVRILTRHVLANAWSPVIVHATVSLGITILISAGLGFLGLGVQSPTPEWGTMLGEGRRYLSSHPHMMTFPGLAIFLAVLACNLVGDGLRDALDPHVRSHLVDGVGPATRAVPP